jgi:hypothetical protein
VNNPDPVANARPHRPWLFQPGQSGNPGGTPKGARKRLTQAFLSDLEKDYVEYGAVAMRKLRIDDPKAYLNIVAKLCPRELEVTQAFEESDNDEMQFLLALAKQYMQARRARTLEAQAVAATEGEIETPK